MASNLDKPIIPIAPRVRDNEQLYVYMPQGAGSGAGLWAIDPATTDFEPIVASRGVLKIWWAEAANNMSKTADSLNRADIAKFFKEDFKYVNVEGFNEIGLRRDRDAFLHPELVKLDFEDFHANKNLLNLETTYSIKRNNPFEIESIVKLDGSYFDYHTKNKLQIKYPYANQSLTNVITNGFGLVNPKVGSGEFLKYDSEGKLEFNIDFLTTYMLSDAAAFTSDAMPTYGADAGSGFSDIANYFKLDSLGRGIAVRDEQTNRVKFKISKDSVGLSNVANKSFTDWKYDDFGSGMQNHFNTQFGLKLSQSEWDALFANWNPPAPTKATPNQWLNILDTQVEHLSETVNDLQSYKGIFANPEALESAIPASTGTVGWNAFVISTSTYWVINASKVWENTLMEAQIWQDAMEVSALSYLPNGVASAGSTGKWAQSNHIHPTDTTRLDATWFRNTSIKVTTNPVSTGDFTVNLWDGANQLNAVRSINVPYVLESMYGHNWQGQGNTFIAGKFVRTWIGTQAQLAADFGGNVPDDVLTYVTDDYYFSEGNIPSINQMIDYVAEQIDGAFALPNSNDQFVRKGNNWVNIDLSALDNYLKKDVTTNLTDGAISDNATNSLRINGKNFITMSAGGELGLSFESGTTAQTLKYKGGELLGAPAINSTSKWVYGNNKFEPLTASMLDSIFGNFVVTGATMYGIIEGIQYAGAVANSKMPKPSALSLGNATGGWTQFTNTLNLGISIPAQNPNAAGSIGQALWNLQDGLNNSQPKISSAINIAPIALAGYTSQSTKTFAANTLIENIINENGGYTFDTMPMRSIGIDRSTGAVYAISEVFAGKIVCLTQAAYNAITTKDASTMYFIYE